MKLPLALVAIGTLLASPLATGTAVAQEADSDGAPRYIVMCKCNTPAKRKRVQEAISRAGGDTVLTYKGLGGFAVEASDPRYLPRLEDKLRRIPGVTSVERDGESGISAAG
jgi:hypothetical protein